MIEVERPGAGDLTRTLYLSDTEIGGDSTIFDAINPGKESLAIDLKNEADPAAAAAAATGRTGALWRRPGILVQRPGRDQASDYRQDQGTNGR
ncbi:CoA transferase family III [Hoeflea halophila]|uniref:CoA transferase family III n=1 Tax=Hoeflea halophila TaxID=714899 RepID=A0A286IFR4_9HYPH|nr:CoA transferase family III [Hoeflea halophila]